MHKHYFGIASIIFAIACLIWSIGQATAFPQGPNIGLGSNPHESFTGSTNGTVDLLTVPANQIFIVTTCVANSVYISLKENTDMIIDGYSEGCTTGALHDGNGHLVISSGSTLRVESISGTRYYYIEGYYAQP